MNWKSYTVVSGATVLAGWLASTPPSTAPAAVQAPGAEPPPAESVPTDIEMQAMRLQARLRAERTYVAPSRDPFRFAPRRQPAAPAVGDQSVAALPGPRAVDAVPAAPRVTLAGIAEDQVDGRTQRTAVLSTPAGVLLVREGEEILGYYHVARVEAEAVELVALGDGTTARLMIGAKP